MSGFVSGINEEPPCVWVLAGVLNHRPCHRNYECEGCELYQALQGRGAESGMETPGEPLTTDFPLPDARRPDQSNMGRMVTSYMGHMTEDCTLHLDRPYSTGHFWVQERDEGELLLGLDCQVLRILFPVEDIVAPRPGVWLTRGEPMGWLLRDHLALPLRPPVAGEVLEVNEALLAELREYGFPKTRDRWLVRLKAHEALEQVPGLLRGEAMLRWHQEKLGLIRKSLERATGPSEAAGPTLNDGGEINRNLEEVLGAGPFKDLVDLLFREVEKPA